MKKQFNRMRQLANQTVGRAEKTEVLSEDLLQVEKRLELVKQVSHSTHKKLTACLQGQQGAEADKRSKKLPLTTLAQCLMEGSAILGDDTLLGKMLKLCGETEDELAQELIHFELRVERDVIEPLFLLAEVEIPNIQKQRKHLAKLVLDMDSSRTSFTRSLAETLMLTVATTCGYGGSRLPSLQGFPAAFSLRVPKPMPSGRRWRRLPTEWRFAGTSFPLTCTVLWPKKSTMQTTFKR